MQRRTSSASSRDTGARRGTQRASGVAEDTAGDGMSFSITGSGIRASARSGSGSGASDRSGSGASARHDVEPLLTTPLPNLPKQRKRRNRAIQRRHLQPDAFSASRGSQESLDSTLLTPSPLEREMMARRLTAEQSTHRFGLGGAVLPQARLSTGSAPGATSERSFARSNDAMLAAIMQSSRLSEASGAVPSPFRASSDEDDVWGQGDETDEKMQRLLEQSYFSNRQNRPGNDEPTDDDALLQAAIEESLEAAGLPLDNLQTGAEEDPEIIQMQIQSMEGVYPEEVVNSTVSLFTQMQDAYKDGSGARPDFEKALERAEAMYNTQKEQSMRIEMQMEELRGEVEDDVFEETKKLFKELVEQQRESGGQAPSIEYALSIVQDRAKAKAKEAEEAELAKEAAAKAEQEAQALAAEQEREAKLLERQQETREQRAARMAAAFDRKRNQEQTDTEK